MKTKFFFVALCVLTMSLVACDPNEPSKLGTKSGAFSISPTEQVRFAPGNLQYQASTETWRFAEHQYDVIGEDNKYISSTYDGWIDLFSWGTGDYPTKNSFISSDYTTFVDWGINRINSSAPNTWRTLTMNEWEYILKWREYGPMLHGLGTVNGIKGLIILPDNYKGPEGFTFNASAILYGDGQGNFWYEDRENTFSSNIYTLSEWEKLEATGAVFLPTTGGRYTTGVKSVESMGAYWTPSIHNMAPMYLHFKEGKPFSENLGTYGIGLAVRLAKDL